MVTAKIHVSCIFLADPFTAKIQDLVAAIEKAAQSTPLGSELPMPMELADHLAKLMGQTQGESQEARVAYGKGVSVLCGLVRRAYANSVMVGEDQSGGRFFTKSPSSTAA